MKEIENHFALFSLPKDNIVESQNNHKKGKKMKFTGKLARKKKSQREKEWNGILKKVRSLCSFFSPLVKVSTA